MSKYWLEKSHTLEMWTNTGLRVVRPNGRHVKLPRAMLEFLLTCDGREQEPTAEADSLLRHGVVVTDGDLGMKPSIVFHDYLYRGDAVVGITGRCNYSCRHCIAASGTSASCDELTLEECKGLFAQMRELGMRGLWFTGGEPLAHPRFPEIVQAASGEGLRIERILTNGSLVTEELLDWIAACGQRPSFGISFDGVGTHDWMRCREGAEEASLAAIDLVVKRGFSVMPHINVNGTTAPKILETCRVLVRDHGCKSLRLIPTSRSPRWMKLARPEDIISYDDYYTLMLSVIRTAHDEGWNVELDLRSLPQAHNPRWRRSLGLLKDPPAINPCKSALGSCARTEDQIFVAPDGRVLPCNAYEGNSKQYGFLVGDDINIRKRSLKDILTASEYVSFCKDSLGNLLDDRPECRECKWVGVCRGGCPLFALGNRQRLADENPNCSFFKGGWVDRYIALVEDIYSEK